MFNSSKNRKPSFRLALLGVMLALTVIVLGAFTRLVDAGLGCPDWPTCYGHVMWPMEAAEIATANKAYPDAPVATDKTWPEMVHRYFATALGLLSIGLVLVAWRHRGATQPLTLPLFLLAFVILQGLFGMWTVTLKLWPQVVTAHLLGGFATLSLLWLLTLRLNNQQLAVASVGFAILKKLRTPALIGLLIVIVQIALGGWTTANYAAVACPDLPACQGQWLPVMDVGAGFNLFQSIGPNYLGGVLTNEARIAIHMSHRTGAILTLLYVGWLCLGLLRQPVVQLRRFGKVIGAVLALQFCLGLANIWFKFPLLVTVSHSAVGALLLLTMVTLNYCLLTARERA